MTPMTTTRPTIVRTIEPPPGPDECVGVAVPPDDRCSGVLSPSAAKATGAVSRQPRTAAPRGRRREGRLRINTEGFEPGSGAGLISAAGREALSRAYIRSSPHPRGLYRRSDAAGRLRWSAG